MSKVNKIFLQYLASIIFVIFVAEALLELRHYYKGYDTLLYGSKPTQSFVINEDVKDKELEKSKNVNYGPTKLFPFKSVVLNESAVGDDVRIWIASASHADGGRLPASAIFPNIICQFTNFRDNCAVINGSSPGMRISKNVSQLVNYASLYEPDAALLYQMTTIISDQQNALMGLNSASDGGSSHGIFDISTISKKLQETALYTHLSDFIGGNIKLQGPLKAELPENMFLKFDQKIYDFIAACNDLGVKPILATFAASHNSENIHEMHFSEVTNLVKYNSYLSPKGWTKTIKEYNSRLRNIANKENIPLVDIEEVFNGRYELFIDFFHFNAHGHSKVGQYIGEEISKIIPKVKNKNDI